MTAVEDVWAWIQPVLGDLVDATKPWSERREAALKALGIANAEENAVTAELFRRLDASSEQDLDALNESTLSSEAYAIILEVEGSEDESAEGEGYDEGAWKEFVAQMGPQWNGEEDAWPYFSEQFQLGATAWGLGQPATEFLDHLGSMPTAERIAMFAGYGVTITTAEADSGDTAGESGESETEEADAVVNEAADQLAAIPGIENLSREDLERVIAKVLQDAG